EVVEETSSIVDLFENLSRPLCYKLEENETASIAVYVPDISGNEIIIDLAPENRKEAADVLGIKNTVISGSEAAGAREEITSNEEEALETGKNEAQNEEYEVESTAFEFGFAIAGIVAAYGLRRRK
ncbi:MAG: hypothetical protein QG610_505, partial [Euryarchaeota archaeon]|nr:hypothetical protein [Euryarchaeota archaeon]